MRILMITSRFPWPPWRGNQIRTVQWLEALADHDGHEGHDVTLLAPPAPCGVSLDGRTVHAAYRLPLATRLAGLGLAALDGRPLQEGWSTSRSGRQRLGELLDAAGGPAWDLAIVQMVRCGWALDLLRELAPDVPVVLDAIDSMSLHFERTAADGGPVLRPLARCEARRCRAREHRLVRQAELTIAVAGPDLEALDPPLGHGLVIPVAGRLPPADRPAGAAAVRPGLILLSGNLGYRPTLRGALWFAEEVWPALHRRVPGCRWRLAGARPPRAVRRLARLPGVELVADPDDLGPHIAAATVAIAPMQTGSGVPMKVLEAWAAGVPIVATPQAAAGLDPGTLDALEVADGGEAWVERLAQLLADQGRRQALAAAGRAAWQRRYHPDLIRRALREAAVRAAGSSRRDDPLAG
jgi:glycosyltransferase involved in cell wall biosynthesis